jgi:uncharacterized membrane protein YjdF
MAMKIYWGYKDVPELAGLSWRERGKVIRACYWKVAFRNRRCWVAMLVGVVIVVLAVVIGDTLRYEFGKPDYVAFACFMVGGMAGQMIYRHVLIQQLRPHFRDYIAGRKPQV